MRRGFVREIYSLQEDNSFAYESGDFDIHITSLLCKYVIFNANSRVDNCKSRIHVEFLY